MAPASISAIWLGSQKNKLRDGLDPVIKVMVLILAKSLNKLKTHVVRKRELNSKDIFKDKTSKWFTVCSKYM